MKLLFTALLILATAVGFTMLAQRDPGYVLISYSDWSVESSLSLFLVLIATTFVIL